VEAVVVDPPNKKMIQSLYREARQVRIQQGHDVAEPLYAHILQAVNPTDMSTATRLAAAVGEPLSRFRMACKWSVKQNVNSKENSSTATTTQREKIQFELLRSFFLHRCHFTARAVSQCLGVNRFESLDKNEENEFGTTTVPCAPIYVTGAAPGTVHQFPFPRTSTTPTQCCVALFLLGVAVPTSILNSCFHTQDIQLLLDFGLVCYCEYDRELVYGLVSIVPVDICAETTLYVVTDWHPRVLNLIRISEDEETVMYIGPDSLALVQHWTLRPTHCPRERNATFLDLCTGSGIQALVALALGTMNQAVCVDTNPRALRFTAFSAGLNGLEDKVVLVNGDLLQGTGCMYPSANKQGLLELLKRISNRSDGFDMITVNPPYLPVPDGTGTMDGIKRNIGQNSGHRETGGLILSSISKRYGLFSAGGNSGEDVLAAAVNLSNSLLKRKGFLAVVSEFFFRNGSQDENVQDSQCLLRRLRNYWSTGFYTISNPVSSSRGLLLTNQFPISSTVYAERRADSAEEANLWKGRLQREGITSCSPGLLYIQKSEENDNDQWVHVLVPKTGKGSIWTPANSDAIKFTQTVCENFFASVQHEE
jgi:methylase of polypeptide subunit release factors